MLLDWMLHNCHNKKDFLLFKAFIISGKDSFKAFIISGKNFFIAVQSSVERTLLLPCHLLQTSELFNYETGI